MNFSRRDFIHSGCTLAAITLAPHFLDVAKAGLIHRSAGVPTGKNQIGLNGISNFNNIKPFTNWLNSAGQFQLTIVGAISAGGGTITQTGGTATITTPNPHGFYNGSSSVSGWNLAISGATQSGYNLSGAIFTITGPTTITYPVNAGTASPATTAGAITYSVILTSAAQNLPNSFFGASNNKFQFFNADGYPQPNISNAISLAPQWIYSTLNGTSYQPPGYTRNGQVMVCKWTGNSSGTVSGWTNSSQSATLTWTTAMDTQNLFLTMNIPNPADVPTSIFLGLSDGTGNPATDNYAAWLAGTYVDSVYISQIKNSCGVVRFMDWQNTNGNFPNVLKYSDVGTINTRGWGSATRGMPVAVMCQVSNQANKHPWLNIPWDLGQVQYNNTVSGISKASTAVVTFSVAHTFAPGDQVIGNVVNGNGSNNAGFGTSATVTFNVAGSFCTWAGNTFSAGQNVQFSGGTKPSNVNNVQTYYVTNVGAGGANTFQLAATLANALAGTAITMTGSSSGTITGSSQINRIQFTVGAVTTYTMELLNCDSTSFGTASTTGSFISPFNLSGMTTEITNYVTAIKNGLAGQLVPRFEFGNEMWNSIFGGFAWNSSQSHNFINATTGAQNFGNDDNNKMQGFVAAHVMKIVRDVYGGSAGRALWQGLLVSQYSNSGVTSGMISGVDYYLANILGSSLTRNDLFDNIAIAGYYGGAFKSNGSNGNFANVTIAATSPATVTLASGTNNLPVNSPVIFTSSGTLPNDLATGQPLVRGDMSAVVSGIAGFFSGTTLTVTTITGTPLTVGMTIWPSMGGVGITGSYVGNNIAYNGVQPAIIQSLGTGVGGVGTYNMSVSQTAGSVGSPIGNLAAMDTNKNCQVYWTTSTGNTFTFSATRGGANVNVDPANPGSGTQNCLTAYATLLCSWMNQSVANNASNPATYPSRYTFWNQTLNTEVNNGQFLGLVSASLASVSVLQATFFQHVTFAVTTGPTMPSALGMVQYEGGQSDEPQGNAPNGGAMSANPMFQEFWPQAVGTNEDAANWTASVAAWAGLKAYAIGQGLPNASALVTGYPSKFVDATILSYQFGFGGLDIVDHFQGIGFPTWQNQGLNSHALYDAVVATN